MRSTIWRCCLLAGLLALPAACRDSRSETDSVLEAFREFGKTASASNANRFLASYTERYLELSAAAAEAEWALNTKIVQGDDTNKRRAQAASEELARFTGAVEVIDLTRRLLEQREDLEPLEAKQLEAVLYQAADKPQTAADLVRDRIEAETAQTEALFGFDFRIDGESVTTNRIDEILVESSDEAERLAAWEASKEVGPVLKTGLANLVSLRNHTVQALGYANYFEYQVSDYGLTSDEMMALMRQLMRELRPLYREIHTWARYELAERYGKPVPELLPAHWLPNR